MKKHILILLVLLSATSLWARKPPDTLSAGRWEFVQNLGQWNSSVRFSARMNGGALFFGNNFLTVTQLHPGQLEENREAKHNGKPFPFPTIDAAAYRVTFLDANPAPAVEGVNPYDHYYNYYIGNPKQWASHVLAYNNIIYIGLYDKKCCLKPVIYSLFSFFTHYKTSNILICRFAIVLLIKWR